MDDAEQKSVSGTLRLLLFVCVVGNPSYLDFARVLGVEGDCDRMCIDIDDDITNGDGDFGDSDEPLEFHDMPDRASGLWVVEWPWRIVEDEDMEMEVVAYGVDQWSRPTLADLLAFGVL